MKIQQEAFFFLTEDLHYASKKRYYRKRPNNYGLTHGAHREENVLTDSHQIHIINFDLPSMNRFIEDIARPFYHSIIYDTKNWQERLTLKQISQFHDPEPV